MEKRTKSEKMEWRQTYNEKLDKLFTSYSKILIVSADNIRSNQISRIRRALRNKAELIFGKKTLMERYLKSQSNEELKQLLPYIKLNIGLIFTNGEYKDITTAFEESKRKAGAKPGMIAPSEVVIQPMLTTMGPDQHSFFASLSIDTKINKGKIEITNTVHLVNKGDIVSPSHATLLNKLEIEPFYYQMEAVLVYDNGQIFDASILNVDDEVMQKKWNTGLEFFVSAALGANIAVLPAIPHIMIDSMKTLMGVGAECGMDQIAQVKRIMALLK
ncbi:Acidic ribosomal protein P0 [Spironucleus salmonicida]|uniref:Acidic ribosomal protein P0 n=1 Tax=Spironucleus salmonicida TaxID=348837 RepID=V6LU42_9EUKA|nr:Acidic ribosomal protein P0 [Spironucleus salmonicida]|eukprot:EST44314.1 Acidic ribosomal protein P0 [Spironucleus salmonicida]